MAGKVGPPQSAWVASRATRAASCAARGRPRQGGLWEEHSYGRGIQKSFDNDEALNLWLC
eukprot:6194180-Pleurochrysis_carterae.AAC.3